MLGGKAKEERLQPEVSDGVGVEGRVGDEARAGKGRIGIGEWEEKGTWRKGWRAGKGVRRCVWRGGG